MSVSSALQLPDRVRLPTGEPRMQQATTEKPPNDSAPTGAAVPHLLLRNRFVINLCGSTTPVALTPPDHAGLKRFTFFVSRRREEGRERFRLHMGYFDSQEDAERLLDIVREIYPGAWAGLAPGQRLQAQAEAAAAASASADSQGAGPPVAAASEPQHAAPIAAALPMASPPDSPAAAPVASTPPSAATAAPAEAIDGALELPALSLVPDEGRSLGDTRLSQTTDNDAAARALRNVRAAIASLGETSPSAPTLSPLPELKPAPQATAAAPAAA